MNDKSSKTFYVLLTKVPLARTPEVTVVDREIKADVASGNPTSPPHVRTGQEKMSSPPRIVTVTCSARLDVTSCHWVAHLLIHGLRELIFPVYQVHCTQNNRNDDITIILPVILLTYHHSLRTFFKVQLGTNADKIFFFFFCIER